MADVEELNGTEKLSDAIEREKGDLFGPISEEIENENVTDIEWDGTHLWITDLTKGCYMSDKSLSDAYVTNLSIRLSNIMKEQFSRANPILEANTDKLRISIWHDDRCGKKSITIRKIPKYCRFDHDILLKQKYAPESLINLLENCIRAHMSVVVGGQPHAGKTELLKYLTRFIPANEKAGVYEDNQEIHYKALNPNKKGVEFYVDEKIGFADAIKAGLRHNIDWCLLSESRGPEIIDLLNALSTGAHCMTTVHLEDVRRLADRFYNMAGPGAPSVEQFTNTVHRYINVGILVECDKDQKRKIKQVAFFTREHQINKCVCIFDEFEYTTDLLTDDIIHEFAKGGIMDPFGRDGVYDGSRKVNGAPEQYELINSGGMTQDVSKTVSLDTSANDELPSSLGLTEPQPPHSNLDLHINMPNLNVPSTARSSQMPEVSVNTQPKPVINKRPIPKRPLPRR